MELWGIALSCLLSWRRNEWGIVFSFNKLSSKPLYFNIGFEGQKFSREVFPKWL